MSRLAVAVAVAAIAALVLSCSSKAGSDVGLLGPDGADGGALVTRAPSGGTVTSGGSGIPDGGSIDASALCASAKQLGGPTEELAQEGASFAPSGGTVVAGTYTLSGLYSYVGSDAGDEGSGTLFDGGGETLSGGGPTGYEEEKTLVIESDGSFSLISASGPVDGGVGASAILAGAYTVSDTTITLVASCPTSSSTVYSFAASGGTLALYEPTGGLVDVFQLQP